MKVKRTIGWLISLLVLSVIGGGFYLSRSQWVPAGHVGVIFSAYGGLSKEVIKPRRVFVPWMSQLYVYPTMIKAAIYTNDPNQGEVRAADAIQVTTSDNANTPFDVIVWYRIKPEDLHKVFESFRAVPIEEIQRQHIRAAVREAANAVGPKYDAFQLMGPKRAEASTILRAELESILARKGVTIEGAEFAGAYPSAEILNRITGRINSLTDLKIAEIKQEIARVQRDTAVIKAKAEAEAQQLASSQTKERSLDLLRLEADVAAVERWDGHLSPLQVKPGQTVIVSPDTLNVLQASRGGKRQ